MVLPVIPYPASAAVAFVVPFEVDDVDEPEPVPEMVEFVVEPDAFSDVVVDLLSVEVVPEDPVAINGGCTTMLAVIVAPVVNPSEPAN